MKMMILPILMLMAVLLVSGCTQQQTDNGEGCPEDGRVCEDGSTVYRNPNLNCEFDPCPETQPGVELTGAMARDLEGFGWEIDDLNDEDLDNVDQDIDEILGDL